MVAGSIPASPSMKVYSAFCGTGKSFLCQQSDKYEELECWKYRDGNFPTNYIEDVKKHITETEYLFISTDPVILKQLKGFEIVLIYPNLSLKTEYLQRYIDRQSPNEFVDMLDKNWNNWLTELVEQDYCTHVVLETGQHLEDILTKK